MDIPPFEWGSSPQVRGTRGRCGYGENFRGLIPAGAGNTRYPRPSKSIIQAHPRRCGEHHFLYSPTVSGMGSSPQVRGTLKTPPPEIRAWGLIPAGAGNTEDLLLMSRMAGAHPRRCGEHVTKPEVGEGNRGSSPQVRGTRLGVLDEDPVVRLIPAGAGNTNFKVIVSRSERAHPRRCGEHVFHLSLIHI